MTDTARATLFTAAPYVSWMALMFLCPLAGVPAGAAYAARTCVAAVLLAAAARVLPKGRCRAGDLLAGLAAGVLVTVLWVAPEYSAAYREWCVIGDVPSPAEPQTSQYAPSVCGWPLTLVRLFGSAFIIAPAEELFFRSFLYRRLQSADWTDDSLRRRFDLSAFLWTTGLFALEHNRLVAAAVAGAVYGLVYMRHGLFAASVAHALTNLLLAVYVLATGAWAFW